MKALLKNLPLACLVLTPMAYADGDAITTEPAPETVSESMPVTEAAPAEAAPADDVAMEAAPAEAPPAEYMAPETTTTETVTETTETTTMTESAPGPARVTDYVSLLGTYYFLEDKQWIAEEGYGAHLIRGWNLGGNWYIEGNAFTAIYETDVDGATDFYRSGLGADLVYAFGDRHSFTPFALIGGGAAYNDVVPDSFDDWAWHANAGLGFITGAISDFGFRIRLEGRYIYNSFEFNEKDSGDVVVGLGLELPLALPGDAPVTPLAVVEERVQVVTTDQPGDADGDGVLDPYDSCPDTPQGMEVDGRGCALPQVLTLTGVVFDFNKATLTPDARTILDGVAKKIVAYKKIPMELAGHTDNVGSDEYNMTLSDLRAKAVLDYLVEQGVSKDGLSAKGYGESQPAADNGTDAGRQVNRRVELRIEGQK